MDLTVIIATYNGEKYIKQQLLSIYNQTVFANKVIISDDCSTDNTVQLIKEFIQSYSLSDNWTLITSEKNVGWRKNFQKLLLTVDTDWILFCDQDDYWLPNKIELFKKAFITSNAEVVCANFNEEIDVNGNKSFFKSIKTIKKNKIRFNHMNIELRVPGWNMGINKKIVPLLMDIWKDVPDTGHDNIVWLIGVVHNSIYYIPEVTGNWRKHCESAIFKEHNSNHSKRKNRIDTVNNELVLLETFLSNSDNLITKKKNYIINIIKNDRKRIEILENKSVYQFVKSMFSYKSFYYLLGDFKYLF